MRGFYVQFFRRVPRPCVQRAGGPPRLRFQRVAPGAPMAVTRRFKLALALRAASEAELSPAAQMPAVHTLISIVNYRTPELTVACLESLASEVQANPGSTVIVVDNDSGDRSVEIIGQAIKSKGFERWCRLVAAPLNGGFAYGNNLALRAYRESSGDDSRRTPDYLWLLNPDTIVIPGALTRLLSFMTEQGDAGIVGGLSVNEDGTRRSGGFRFPGILSEAGEALSLGRIVVPLLASVSRFL